jgi:hypothetical protein
MKLKIGPVEIEQDSIKDDILFNEFKESPKEVEKYLLEKSKYFDLTLKNTIAGKTMKMITDFALGLAGGIFFLGWSFYVFYSSRDVFVWQEMNVSTAFSVFLGSLMILFICLLPVILILSFLKILKYFSNRKMMKQLELEEQLKKEKKTSK